MSTSRLPPLNALRAFEAAGRLGSLMAAATELHVTQPAVGRHIRLLEAQLGVGLLERLPRGVRLTDRGRLFHEEISEAFALMHGACTKLQSPISPDWLRLSVVPGLAARWLQPRLPAFRQGHPEVRVSVEPLPWLTQWPADVDLALMYGEATDFAAQAEVLGRPAIFPVCSPDCLKRHGEPKRLSDLLQWPLLHEDEGDWWSDWLRRGGLRRRVHSDVAYGSAETVLQMALKGQGVGLSNAWLVQAELDSGRLVRPVPHAHPMQAYLLLQPPGPLSPAAGAFKAWLHTLWAPASAC